MRDTAPIHRKLHDATREPCVIAFQTTALFNDDGSEELTLPGLMERWKVGRPAATRARKTLIELGYWAYVRPRDANGQLGHEIRVWESPADSSDLAELARQYRPGSRIECAGATFHVTDDGSLIPAGRTSRQKTATWSPSTSTQKTDGWSDQEKQTSRQKTATWSPDDNQMTPGDVSAGRTRRQKTAAYRRREGESPSKDSLLTDPKEGPASDPAKPDAAPSKNEDAAARAVHDLVMALPWSDYATRVRTRFRLSSKDVDEVTAAIGPAIAAGRCTADQAVLIASAALGKATSNPARYIANAFGTKLGDWLRQVDVVAEFEPDPQRAQVEQESRQESSQEEAPRKFPDYCDTCRSRREDPRSWRKVSVDPQDPESPEVPCPKCIGETGSKPSLTGLAAS